MLLNSVNFNDRIEVPSARQITDAGQMIVPCAFARTGGQQYSAGQLGLQDVASDKLVTVMRDEADVFDEASLASFRSAPVTIGHPKSPEGLPIKVTADNSAELQVGVLEGMPTRDEDTLSGTLVIARQDAIDLIEGGTKELSAGYTCDLEMVDEDGESVIYQRNIRANHIAIVSKGRAGSMCAIADEDDTELVEDKAADGGDGLGRNDDKPESAFDPAALEAGIKVEKEHTDSVEKAESIAKDHLSEDPEYYTKLAKMEAKDEASTQVQLEDAVVSLTDERDALLAKVATLQDELDSNVEERVHAILVAKDLTDLEEFSGKSIQEIKHMVVADQMPNLDLDGRSEAYVCARFDVLCEDAEIGETPMGRLLKDNAESLHEVPKPSTLVADARARSIERQKRS